MTKESAHELQLIDCNCNDCKYMVRDFDKFKASKAKHYKWQLDYFNLCKSKASPEDASKMRFEFDSSSVAIHFGYCQKLSKQVSFIPVTCQIETQQCFKHRLAYPNPSQIVTG